jgi:hypothetical protein
MPYPGQEQAVKVKTLVLTLALCFAGATMCVAEDSIGTWKLNEAKSQVPVAAMKNTTVVYTTQGTNIKCVTDGSRDGKPLHTEWIGKFDGKDYPLTGDPAADTRSYTKIDDHTIKVANKKAGKVTASGDVVFSKDGKSRTLTLSGTDANGKTIKSRSVYDKQ